MCSLRTARTPSSSTRAAVPGTLEAANFRAVKEGALRRKEAGVNGGMNGAGQAGLGLVVPKTEE